MADNNQILTPSDDKALPVADDLQLDNGDDLALDALSQASENDEVEQSDKVAETVMSLQNVIERNADQLDKLKNDLKILREQLKDVFENDVELTDAEEQYKTLSNNVKARKTKLQADPTVTRLKVQIGELNESKKEIEEALSGHLVNYYQLTNSTSFDTSDGDQREFSIRASVKGKGKSTKED